MNLGLSLQGDMDLDVAELDFLSPSLTFSPGVRFDCGYELAIAQDWAVQFETGLIYNSLDSLEISTVYGGASTGSVNGGLWQIPLFANLLYYIPINSDFKVYLGAGVGGTVSFLDFEDTANSAIAFGYHAMCGMTYKLNESMDLGLAYKFTGTTSQTFSDTFDAYYGGYYGYYGHYDNSADVDVKSSYNQSIVATLTFKF